VHGLECCSCHDFIIFVVRHLVNKPDALLLYFKKRSPYGNDIACMQFLKVGNVLVHGGHAAFGRAKESGREAQHGEELPCGFVKLSHIPHDVHVPDVIALPWINSATIGSR